MVARVTKSINATMAARMVLRASVVHTCCDFSRIEVTRLIMSVLINGGYKLLATDDYPGLQALCERSGTEAARAQNLCTSAS